MQKQSFSVTFSPLPVLAEDALYYDRQPVPLPYAEDFRLLHYHDRYEIGICESGEGLFLLEDEVFYLCEGDTIFISPKRRHYSRSIHRSAPCLCRFAYVDATRVEEIMRLLYKEEALTSIINRAEALRTPVFSQANAPRETALLTGFLASCQEENPNVSEESRLTLSLFLLALSDKTSDGSPPLANARPNDTVIASAIEYISTHYDKGDTIPDLVRLCSLSESQLRRRFSEAVGMPPIAYRNQLRCKIASTLLTNTAMSVAEIASRVGFGDVSDFYRAFRKLYKVSPSACRKPCERPDNSESPL